MNVLRVLMLALSLSTGFAAPPAPAAPAAAPAPLAERVRGDWVIVLSPEEKRSVDLMAFALSEPVPTDEAIAAKGLTSDEATIVGAIVGLRRTAPDTAQLAEMKRVVAELPNTTLQITADQLTFGLAGQVASGRYEVIEASPAALKIKHYPPDATEPKEAVLTFEGDVLVVSDAGKAAVRFRRK